MQTTSIGLESLSLQEPNRLDRQTSKRSWGNMQRSKCFASSYVPRNYVPKNKKKEKKIHTFLMWTCCQARKSSPDMSCCESNCSTFYSTTLIQGVDLPYRCIAVDRMIIICGRKHEEPEGLVLFRSTTEGGTVTWQSTQPRTWLIGTTKHCKSFMLWWSSLEQVYSIGSDVRESACWSGVYKIQFRDEDRML